MISSIDRRFNPLIPVMAYRNPLQAATRLPASSWIDGYFRLARVGSATFP